MSKSYLDHIRLSSNKRSHLFHPKLLDRNYLRKWKVGDEVNFPEETEHLVPVQNDCTSDDDSKTFELKSYNVRQRSKQTLRTAVANNELSEIQSSAVAEAASENCESRILDPFHNCECVILDIEEGDTLQSLSLKYHCTVSDLKRVNNLISNQEFYALRQLKIPIRKYGMLMEKLPTVENAKSVYPLVPDNSTLNVRTVSIGIGPMVPGGSKEDAIAFFKKMDEDLVKIMLSTKSQKDTLEAAAVALTSPRIQPLFKENTHGVDCGIQWCSLVIFMIIIGLLLPFTIIIYMYSRSPSALSDHTYNDNAYTITLNSFNELPVKGKS